MLSLLLAPSAVGSTEPVAISPNVVLWLARLFVPLARLGANAGTLLALMLALNAVVQPYLGFDHDARLYAAQTLERVQPGSLGDDLYLKYGSQDRYSAFGLLLTPLAAALGLSPAFFLGYLASKALLFWGAVRLLGALVQDRAAVALGGLFLALVPAPFGGISVLCVNESFLTPRLPAAGLTLLALHQLLEGRPVRSLGFLGTAFLLHPIMALGGILAWMLFVLSRKLSPLVLSGMLLGAAIVGTIAVVWRPLGFRLFGRFDDEWRDMVLRTCFFIRPALWTACDWLRIGWGVAVFVAAALGFAHGSARLLWTLLVVAALGVAGTAVGVQSPYLLLVQASPYRAMWLVEFLAIPLGIAWALDLRRRGNGVSVAVGLGVLVAATTDWAMSDLTLTWAFPIAFLIAAIWLRGTDRTPRRIDWLPTAASFGFIAGLVVVGLYNLRTLTVLWLTTPDPALGLDVHPLLVVREQAHLLYKLPLLLLACWLIGGMVQGSVARLGYAAIGVLLAVQTFVITTDSSTLYQLRYSAQARQTAFVSAFLRERDDEKRSTVYWPTDLKHLWFGLGERSYFNTMQLCGCAFSRETAIEGRRRCELVRPFEAADLLRRPPPDESWREALWVFFAVREDEPAPTRADLFRLCADPLLDIVVIPQRFDGLYASSDGKVFVYDCEQLRTLSAADPSK